MIDLKLKIGKWLSITGKDLKGNNLVIVLMFLAFVLMLAAIAITMIDWPKVQFLS